MSYTGGLTNKINKENKVELEMAVRPYFWEIINCKFLLEENSSLLLSSSL